MQVFISSDHQGYALKKDLKDFLLKDGFSVTDIGPENLDKNDDYPDYVEPLAIKVKDTPESRGIVICKNGVGVSIAANKFPGIRAALTWDSEHAVSSVLDDNANVLALPAYYITPATAKEIVKAWLNTTFVPQDRHIRRLKKVTDIETKLRTI